MAVLRRDTYIARHHQRVAHCLFAPRPSFFLFLAIDDYNRARARGKRRMDELRFCIGRRLIAEREIALSKLSFLTMSSFWLAARALAICIRKRRRRRLASMCAACASSARRLRVACTLVVKQQQKKTSGDRLVVGFCGCSPLGRPYRRLCKCRLVGRRNSFCVFRSAFLRSPPASTYFGHLRL